MITLIRLSEVRLKWKEWNIVTWAGEWRAGGGPLRGWRRRWGTRWIWVWSGSRAAWNRNAALRGAAGSFSCPKWIDARCAGRAQRAALWLRACTAKSAANCVRTSSCSPVPAAGWIPVNSPPIQSNQSTNQTIFHSNINFYLKKKKNYLKLYSFFFICLNNLWKDNEIKEMINNSNINFKFFFNNLIKILYLLKNL